MVLVGAVIESGAASGNRSVSLATEGPVSIVSRWLLVNPSRVRSGIVVSGTFGSGLNDAPTPSAVSKASLRSGKSWFTVEGLA